MFVHDESVIAFSADVTVINTIGYEGVAIETFLQKLRKNGIEQIIDVRRNPLSRKAGFSKKALEQHLLSYKIGYVHLPELGIPSSMRRELSAMEDYERIFNRYEQEILPAVPHKIAEVTELLCETPSALLCFESNPAYCHRTRLAKVIARKTGFQLNYIY